MPIFSATQFIPVLFGGKSGPFGGVGGGGGVRS